MRSHVLEVPAVARTATFVRVLSRTAESFKLDRRIDASFFDQKQGEWREEQQRIRDSIAEHEQANQRYISEGVMLLELANRASELFAVQPASEKRRLLDFVLPNCSWKAGELTPCFANPLTSW